MSIGPHAIEIIGSWTLVNGRMTDDEASRRVRSLIETELLYVSTSRDGWEKLYRDARDGRYWELTYPHGEMEGGGPQALFAISSEAVRQKYDFNFDE